MEGWSGYLNRYAGYAKATKALEHTARNCQELGVRFVTGEEGYAVELLFETADQAKKVCVGVKAANEQVHKSSHIILCL